MKKKFYRWLAKWRLIRRYEYLTEVNNLMEEFITNEILSGGSDDFIGESRKQLISLQNETQKQGAMIAFLKSVKTWLK